MSEVPRRRQPAKALPPAPALLPFIQGLLTSPGWPRPVAQRAPLSPPPPNQLLEAEEPWMGGGEGKVPGQGFAPGERGNPAHSRLTSLSPGLGGGLPPFGKFFPSH